MSNNTNIDKQKLFNAILNGIEKINKSAIERAQNGDISDLVSNLSQQDKNSLKAALSDKKKAREILASKQAKEIIKKLSGGTNNG